MVKTILLEYLALSLYAFFAGFTFCDGFRMRNSRKLIFFVTFAVIAIFVFKSLSRVYFLVLHICRTFSALFNWTHHLLPAKTFS